MRRPRLPLLLLAVVILGAAGWFASARLFGRGAVGVAPGHLRLHWLGDPVASAVLPAKVTWCPSTRLGLLEAVSSDTGLVIVLYEQDSISAGPHPVFSPALGAGMPRPGATLAVRWVRDSILVGFRSEAGSVRVQTRGGLVSGSFDGKLRLAAGMDSLLVSGEFRGVPVVTTAVGCP
jgi:hypothetical protein